MRNRIVILTTRMNYSEAREWGNRFGETHRVHCTTTLDEIRGINFSESIIFVFKHADIDALRYVRSDPSRPEVYHVEKLSSRYTANEMITPRVVEKPLAPSIPHDYGFESWDPTVGG